VHTRGTERIRLHGKGASTPVTGRVIGKELINELDDRVGLIIDGIDGQVHHVTMTTTAHELLTERQAFAVDEMRYTVRINTSHTQLSAGQSNVDFSVDVLPLWRCPQPM
jgi:Protein of unknown function (DUF3363)